MTSIEQIAAGLSDRQKRMMIDSSPDDRTGKEGLGVELATGADYAVAKALERRELGHREGPGGSLPGMYWSNALGLEVREHLLGRDRDEGRCHDCGLYSCVCFDDDDQPEEEWDAGEECGRWLNGSLGRSCRLAGTEFCDWDCPHSH